MDELLRALGSLVVNVSALEESLHDAIGLLGGGEDSRAIQVLTAGLPFRTLVEKLGALCTELRICRVPVADVKAYCDHLNAINDRRNAIIHSARHFREGGAIPRRFKRSAKIATGLKLNVFDVTPEEMRELADVFQLAEHKLWELIP